MHARSFFPRGRLVVSTLANIALVAAFALLFVVPGFLRSNSLAHDDDHAPADVALYRTQSLSDHQLLALDPGTLSDLSANLAGELYRELQPSSVIISRDGSTIAGVGLGNDIQVHGGLTGALRTTLPSDGEIWPLALSADGSKLVASVTADFSGKLVPPAWKVFDTATGNVTAAIKGERDRSNSFIQVVDPVGWKLYSLLPVDGTGIGYDGPLSAKLVAIDLTTGSKIGQVELTEVLMGAWSDEFLIELPDSDIGITRIANPGIAVSPDGKEVAVVHAQDSGVTLIDAATLLVERTMTLKQKQGFVDVMLSSLQITPRKALAKSPAMGASIRAFYTADGQSLIIGGNNIAFDPAQTDSHQTGRGLTLVDLRNGTIEAQSFDEFEVNSVVAMPNGEVYLTGIDWKAAAQSKDPFVIARLDGHSLQTLAKRSFPSYVVFFVVPETHA